METTILFLALALSPALAGFPMTLKHRVGVYLPQVYQASLPTQ